MVSFLSRSVPVFVALLLTHSGAMAQLQFVEKKVKLGEVRCGAPLHHRFLFRNSGKEAVTIHELRASCGCLRPVVARHTYLPGEKGEIFVAVHTLGEPAGLQTWRAHVTTARNGKLQHQILTVSAVLKKEVIVEPATILIHTAGKARHIVQVTDTRPKPFQIRHLLCSSDFLEAKVLGTRQNKKGQKVRLIELKVKDQLPAGQSYESLNIFSDDRDYPQLQVPVMIVKRKPLAVQLSPPEAQWQGTRGKPLPSRIVLLRTSGDQEVTVDRALTGDPAIRCRWAQGPGKMATLKIQVDAAKITKGTLRSYVDVYLTSPTVTKVRVPVRCELR